MKMDKPTVEAVRFNSADVIATSGGGPDTFTVSKYNNGIEGDLTVTYMGTPHTSWESLYYALEAGGYVTEDGSFINTDTPAIQGRDGTSTIVAWYSYDDAVSSGLNPDVNGTYTWYDTGKYWKHK